MSINIIIPKAMSLCLAIQLCYLSEIKNWNIPSPLHNSNWFISPLILFYWHQPHQLPMDPWWMSHGVFLPSYADCREGAVHECSLPLALRIRSRTLGEYHLFEWKTGKRHGNKFRVGDEFKFLDTDSFLRIPEIYQFQS